MVALVWMLIRRVYLLPALAVFVATLAYQVDFLDWRYALWDRTSETAHSALQLAGPIIVGAGAFAALRLTRNTGLFGQPSTPRYGSGLTGLHLGAGMISLGGAYAVGLAPLFVWTTVTATWGHPLAVPLLNALVSVAACLCVGYALGRLLPSPVLPPLSAVAAFWALGGAAAAHGDGWNMLTPVRFRQYRLGGGNNLEAVGFQILMYGLLAAAGIGAVILLARWAQQSWAWRRGFPAVVAATPLLLIPVGLHLHPSLFTAGKAVTAPVCLQTSSVPVCAHPALQSDLPAAAAVASRLVALYGGALPNGAERIAEGSDRRLLEPGDLRITLSPSAPLRFYVAITLTQQLAGWDACGMKYTEREDKFGNPLRAEQADVAQAISGWLNRHAAYEVQNDNINGERATALLERLDRLPEATMTHWLHTNRDRVARCDIRISELP